VPHEPGASRGACHVRTPWIACGFLSDAGACSLAVKISVQLCTDSRYNG